MFDNDGTLWCEKPLPIQADFILRRLSEMAEADPELRDRQPWKAAYERDYGWLGAVLAEHYAGDDTNVRTLAGGHPRGVRGDHRRRLRGAVGRVPAHGAASDARPRLPRVRVRADGRAARLPGGERVLELHRLRRRSRLHAADQPGGVRHPARAGDRQRDRRSSTRATTSGGTITHKAEADYLDDGPQKPIRIWSRIGRRPLLAAGNSNGDIPMLDFTQHEDKPFLRLLVLHDDAEREFDYTSGAEQALERAASERLDGRQHEERLGHRLLTAPVSVANMERARRARARGLDRRQGRVRAESSGRERSETRGTSSAPGAAAARRRPPRFPTSSATTVTR